MKLGDKPALSVAILGKPSDKDKPAEDSDADMGDSDEEEVNAMHAFSEAMKGDDPEEQLEAFKALSKLCGGAE